jgi:hypothetical protein
MHIKMPNAFKQLFRDELGAQLLSALAFLVFLSGVAIEHYAFEKASVLFALSPFSIFSTTGVLLRAVVITTAFAWSSFVVCWFLGYTLAIICALVAKPVAIFLRNMMDFFYIVPIVLVIPLVQLLLKSTAHAGVLENQWPLYLAAAIPILAGAFFLSGYEVFDSCYQAMMYPDDRTQRLVDALYVHIPKHGRRRIMVKIVTLGRLIDFNIQAYNSAVLRALHLSFVAVVIVEIIIPGVYSNIFHSMSGSVVIDDGFLFGVGGEVLKLQGTEGLHGLSNAASGLEQLGNIRQIAGMIWLIFVMDWLAQFALRIWQWRRVGRHYRP